MYLVQWKPATDMPKTKSIKQSTCNLIPRHSHLSVYLTIYHIFL